MIEARKMVCKECNWRGTEPLKAASPFDPSDMILGCPDCLEVNTMRYACDEPDCWKEGSCGWPSPGGYRHTCFEHWDRG